ncbi:MAG: hypothetical protein R3B40_17375 [Polyangiales bacterium]
MTPLDRDSAFLLALGASIAVHALGAGAAAAFRQERAERPGVVREERVELEWLTYEPVREPEFVEPPAPLEPPPEAEDPVHPSVAQPADPVAAQPGETAAEVGPTPSVSAPSELPAEGPPPSPPDVRVPPRALDPRAVALGVLDVAPHEVAPQAVPDAVDSGARFRGAEAALDRHLAAQAATRPAVSERPRPQVRRQADGSYRYRGHAFTAQIDREGQVHFSDRTGMAYNGGGDLPDSVSVSFGFDLTDAAYRRRGQDPYQAERAWFMRETEELREELQREARERARTTLARRVAGRAQQTWDTVERSPEARRRRIFALWDDCAEDDLDGDAAREAIVGWVRRHLPQGSEHAFSPAELSALNGRRQSRGTFAPY